MRVTTPYPASAGTLTRGGLDTSLLTVQITFAGTCNNVTTKISFPAEVNYVMGSVTKISGNTGANIAYSSGPLTAPIFSISGITTAGDITFTLKRVALCGINGAGKDTVSVSGSCGTTFVEKDPVENSYVIFAPSLTVIPPVNNTSAIVGTNISTRTDTIRNGGNGCLDTVFYYLVLPRTNLTMQDDPTFTITAKATTTAGGVTAASFTPYQTNGDTLFYKLSGTVALGPTGKLCNGPSIVISENLKVTGCGSSTLTYGARWGRDGKICQEGTATTAISPISGTPIFTVKTLPSTQSICGTPTVAITDSFYITNTIPVIYDSLIISPTSTTSNTWIDTATLMIGFPGTAPYHPTTGITVNTVNAIGTSLAAGKPVKVTYKLPAAVTLTGPTSMAVTYNLKSDYVDNACQSSFTPSTCSLTHYYHLRCSPTTQASKGSGNFVYGYTIGMNSFTMQTPAVVESGANFNIKVPAVYALPTNAATIAPRRYAEIRLTMPAGVNLISANDLIDNNFLSLTTVGSQVIYRFIPNTVTKSNYVNFTLRNTSACNYQSITTNLVIGLDSLCTTPGSQYAGTACNTSPSIKFKCPPSGGTGTCTGVSGPFASFQRSSLGLADSAQKGRPNGTTLDLSKIDLDRYMVGDTMKCVSSGVISGQAPGNVNFPNVYAEYFFTSGAWDTAGRATVVIKRGNTTFTCNNVTFSNSTVTGYSRWWRANWRTNSCMTSAISYQPGDSIFITATFRLKANYTNSTYELGGRGTGYDYTKDTATRVVHLLYASTVNATTSPVAPAVGGAIGTTGYACDTALYNAYFSGWRHTLNANTVTTNGCNVLNADFSSVSNALNLTAGGQYFLSEYRSLTIPDSFIVTLPLEWQYYNNISGVAPVSLMAYTTKRGAADTSFFTINPTVTVGPDSTRLIFDYATAFQNGTIPFAGTEGALYKSNYQLRPSSCSTPTNMNYTVRELGHIANPFGVTIGNYNIIHAPTSTSNGNLKTGTRPALSLASINNTANIVGGAPQQYWDIQVGTSTYAAPYVWFSVERGLGSITVDSAVYLNSSGTATTTAISGVDYGTGNKMFYLSNNLAVQANQKARIYFRYNNCVLDSAKIVAGYDCNSFPTVPGTASCTVAPFSTMTNPIYLKVTPRPSKIQLSVARDPGNGNAVSFCATDSTIIIVNSASEANIVNVRVQLVAPAGLVLSSSIPVEYPLNSNNWQNLTPTFSGGVYEINLAAHNGIGLNGVRGTLTNAAAEGRQAKVKVIYTTDCNYRSGSRLSFTGLAKSVCGGSAIGDGVKVQSKALNLTGIPVNSGTIDMALSLPATTLDCSNRATISLTNIPLGMPTQANDTLVYTLPAGVAYGGNFTAVANCTGCNAITSPGILDGTTDVKINIPANLAASTSIQYQFDLVGTGGGCGAATIEAAAVRSYPGLSCGAITCTNSTKLVGSQSSGTIMLTRPDIVITDMSLISGNLGVGGVPSFRVSYQNAGGQAAAANTYQLEFMRVGTSAPIYTTYVRKPLGIGTLDADTFRFTLPGSTNMGNSFSVQVSPVMNNGTQQCLCGAHAAALSATPLPLSLLRFDAQKVGKTVSLSWTVNEEQSYNSYSIERSKDGSSYSLVTTVHARNDGAIESSYHASDNELPSTPYMYYRLRLDLANGKHTYSATRKVMIGNFNSSLILQPNPAHENISVQCTLEDAGQVSIRIINSLGTQVSVHKFTGTIGANSFHLPEVAQLPAGNYLLQFAVDGLPMQYARFQVVH